MKNKPKYIPKKKSSGHNENQNPNHAVDHKKKGSGSLGKSSKTSKAEHKASQSMPKASHKHSPKNKNSLFEKIIPFMSLAIIIILIYNLSAVFSINKIAKVKIAEAKELARPGQLSLAFINYPDCADCYNVSQAADKIKSLDVNVTSEAFFDFGSLEAEKLIKKYNITKLPSLIVSGEINKSKSLVRVFGKYGSQKNNAMVLDKQFPPYYDITENRVVGRATLYILEDKSCKYCASLDQYVLGLKKAGIIIANEKRIDVSDKDGQELINELDIKKVPALVLDKEASYYEGFDEIWKPLGDFKKGRYVLRNLNPPYKDLASGEEKGVVHITYLDDSSCPDCYDPKIHKNILSRFGVQFASEETLDSESEKGNSLIKKYNITKVPTIILSGGAGDYPSLKRVWANVGSIDSESGAYIFRNIDAMGKVAYKDLSTGEIVNAAQ